MDVDREMVVEIVVSVAAVVSFVALIVGIGTRYTSDTGFSSTGSLALVGAIVLFILAMAAVGIALAYYLNRPP